MYLQRFAHRYLSLQSFRFKRLGQDVADRCIKIPTSAPNGNIPIRASCDDALIEIVGVVLITKNSAGSDFLDDSVCWRK
ncbi:hypothetical protein HORM4_1020030 [Vibrio harveyi]|nr:hypothetical protein HORM4_1020030 [Vibrio harveyi]